MPKCLVAASVVVLAALTPVRSAGAQQAQLAGAKRPNLRVLQNLPESQLFPLMNLVAQSLGVRCDYCHVQATPDFTKTPSNVGGWKWDSDDKPQKRTARDMMAMTVALNADRFKGEPGVTCYTCHRGSTLTSRTPPLPPGGGAATTPPPLPLPSIDAVWAAYVKAVGADNAAPLAGAIVMTGWDDRPEGRYGNVEIIVAGPDRYRATISTTDTTVRQGLDGDVGWVAANDRVQRLADNDLARARRVAARYRPVKERPADLKVVGVERIGDRDVYAATARVDASTTRTLYFDAVTGLLRRELTATETMLIPLLEQVDYEDYRAVDGVQLPFRVRTSDGAPYDTLTRTFLQIRRNVAVDAAAFRPPSGG